MKRILLIILSCFISQILVSGQEISGYIFDKKTGNPIEYATVYIQGSTQGTVSDSKGYFSILIKEFPSEIVFSHVSYHPDKIVLHEFESEELGIELRSKVIELSDIEIADKSQRERNLDRFKVVLFGEDEWGKKAKLLNEDDVIFDVSYADSASLLWFFEEGIDTFRVWTKAPLRIELPSLGYEIQFDLIKFEESYNPKFKDYVLALTGFLYFKPHEARTSLQEYRYRKNRLKAYYLSPQHFTHALYDNRLYENGFIVYESILNDSLNIRVNVPYNFSDCECMVYDGNVARIYDMKDRYFQVSYYHKLNKSPLNIVKDSHKNYFEISAGIQFLSDNCIIRKDGSRPGGSILFSGGMGRKRIGASLPNDYKPPPLY